MAHKTTVREYTLYNLKKRDSHNPNAEEIGDALGAWKNFSKETYAYYHSEYEIAKAFGHTNEAERLFDVLSDISLELGVISIIQRGNDSHTFNSLIKAVGIDRVRNDYNV